MRKTEERLREEKIEEEILEGCYNSEMQMRAWHDYLQVALSFPFFATWKSVKEDIEDDVKVIDMTNFIYCSQEKDMLVEIVYNNDIQTASLFEMINCDADEKTKEALDDWHYWVNSGNRFEDDEGYY